MQATIKCMLLNLRKRSNYKYKRCKREQHNKFLSRTDKFKNLKVKLNDILEENHWDFDGIFRDHSYSKTPES